MPSAREINRRIKSVTNTQQITKAMKMVSSVRLRRAQERALATAPFTEKWKGCCSVCRQLYREKIIRYSSSVM